MGDVCCSWTWLHHPMSSVVLVCGSSSWAWRGSVSQFLCAQRARFQGDGSTYDDCLEGRFEAPTSHTDTTDCRWGAVEGRWASYATWLKLTQNPALDGVLQLLPQFIAEVGDSDLYWGILEPKPGSTLWEGQNRYGQILMEMRVLYVAIFQHRPHLNSCVLLVGNSSILRSVASCMNYAQELVPCPECQLQLCQQCFSPDQHDPCCLPTLSRKRRAAFPTDCVPHADRLGRRMLSKMANETSPKAADWPPTPPHPEEISRYAEGESCGSCDRGREFCLRGLQCMTCDESGPSLSQRNVSKPLGESAYKPLSENFIAGGIIAPLLLVKSQAEAASVNLAAALDSVRLGTILRVLAEGVLGAEGSLKPEVSKRSCLTDPAGLPFIQRHGPSQAGGASKAIYSFIGLDKKNNFPTSVRNRIHRTGEAAYHRYGVHHVVHTVGPDLRDARSADRSEVVALLSTAYGNVIRAWLSSGLPLLRLVPISAGIFSGTYSPEMPQLTAEAITHALASFSQEEAETLRERIETAGGSQPIQLCVYLGTQVAAFTKAVSSSVIAASPQRPEVPLNLQPSDMASMEDMLQQLHDRVQKATGQKDAEDGSPPTWSELRDLRWQGAVLDQVDNYLRDLSPEYRGSKPDDDAASDAATELAILESAPEPATFDEKDVSDVRSQSAMPACCAYFEDFRVATRVGSRSQRGFRVGAARWLSSIADSGSGNNVISSQVIEALPSDAAIDFVARPPQVLLRSANGQDVVVNGRATITFTLNGYAFRDTFMVIDRGSLCILGNEFIAKRSGNIEPALHVEASSKGSVKLRHEQAPGGWMEATLVSAVGQLSQDGLSTVAPVESPPLLVSKFILEAPDRTIFCYRRKYNTAVATKTFDFPGGKAMNDESHVDAGLRELKEKLTEVSFQSIKEAVEKTVAADPEGAASGIYLAPSQEMHHTRVWVVRVPEKTLLRTADETCCDEAGWRERRLVLSTIGKAKFDGVHSSGDTATNGLLGAYGELLARALNEEGWFNQHDKKHVRQDIVAPLSTSEPSHEAKLLGGGGPSDKLLHSDAIPASQYDVGPELDTFGIGEVERTLPAVPTGGKLPTDQRIKPFEYLLFHVDPIIIPPKTQTTVMLPAPKRLVNFVGPLLVEPAPERVRCNSHLLTAYGITQVVNGKIAVQVINNSHHPDSLPSLAPVAMVRGETVTVVDQAPDTDPTGNLTPEYAQALADLHVDGVCKKGCESCDLLAERRLTEEQRVAVFKLLAKRAHAFAVPPYKTPGQSHAIEVELPLKENARPFKCAASRVGDEGNKIIAKAVEDMERHHIIEKSNSPWASRVVLVKKKDGQPRFCVDLRRLNELLLVEDSPLPRCDDAIDQLGRATAKMSGAVHYHTLDLTAGFWALNIKPEHRERTAFVTNMGKWHFRRLPFGLRSGPSYMQRLMESTLQGLSWDICLPYIDDIAIWASGDTPEAAFDQALHRLDLVLERLEWAGLTCKPSKCSLFAAQVEYLGHVCSQQGVSLDPKKITGISGIDVDSVDSLAKVRSFLGLCGYYRRHVEDFHIKSAPLVALTKSGVIFPEATNNPDVKRSIRELKEALCKNPVLAYPRNDREFIVKSDAATGHGIGAVLTQRDDADEEGKAGEERPVCFYGRKFTSHEANYSATEAELLGVVEAIRQFRPYLWGRRFRVVTDHAALRWLHTMNGTQEGGPQSRLTRWVIKLQEYNFYVEHKPGKHHVDCDAISRLVGALESGVPHSFYGKSEWCQPDGHDLIYGAPFKDQLHSELAAEVRKCLDRDASLRVEQACYGPAIVSSLSTGTSNPPKTPSRHKVRQGHPMKQFFGTLPTDEGGVPSADSHGVPLERDGSAVTAKDFKVLQQQDSKCSAITTFLTSGVMPSELKLASFVRQHARHCTFLDGTLFRVVRLHPDEENERELHLPWVPESCQQSFLHAFHDQQGHQGRERTWQALRRQVYWPTSYSDVAEHVMRCHECCFSKQHRTASRGVIPALGKYPFDLVTVDLVDMVYTHLGSTKGYRKCLVFVDSLSRWVEAVALKSEPTAEEYVQLFCEHVVARYGVPRALRSDRGSNLSAVIVTAVNSAIGTKMLISKAHHHESAASVERFNKTLEEMVRAVDPGGTRWEEWLPFLLYSYRATPHRVTSESPAYLLYGRELRGPSEAILDTRGMQPSNRQSAENTVRKLRVAWRLAEAATLKQQIADKSDRDRKMEKPPEFQTDDRVLVRRENVQAKLEDLYDGPYRVVSGPDERGNYRLRDLHSKRMHDEIAVPRLKMYSTITEIDRVAPDEYIVEALLQAEDRPLLSMGPNTAKVPHFLVKWRGYSLKNTTWEPRSALMLRCSDMVQAYELTRGQRSGLAAEAVEEDAVPPQLELHQSNFQPNRPRQATSAPSLTPPVYETVNAEQPRASTSTSSRSSRLAAQPRKSYNETRSRKDAVAALFDCCVKTPMIEARDAPREWLAGRYWSPTQVGPTQFWQPEASVNELADEVATMSPLVAEAQLENEWVYVVFCTKKRGYTWQLSDADGQLLHSCPGGRVLSTDHFYSSQGAMDASEASLQASHRLLREQLLCYPWEVKERVEQVILKTPGGHVVATHDKGLCRWWAVVTPEHFDVVPREVTLRTTAGWRSIFEDSCELTCPQAGSKCSLFRLWKVGKKAQPDPPLTVDVLAVLSSRGRSSSSNSMGDGPSNASPLKSRHDAAESLLQLGIPKEVEIIIADAYEVFWGQLAGETPMDYAVRVDEALVCFLNAMYATFHVNTKGIIESTPRRRLASGAMEPLEGHPFFLDARWWRELATFLEGTPFREKMARLSFCAVLARLLWPTQLTTDLLAGQAFGVQVRQMTRWNTRIAELTASICQAAGIDQATWAIPAKIKAIGSSSSAGPSSTLPSSPRRELRMPTMYVGRGVQIVSYSSGRSGNSYDPRDVLRSFLIPGFSVANIPSRPITSIPVVPEVVKATAVSGPSSASSQWAKSRPSHIHESSSYIHELSDIRAADSVQLRKMLPTWKFLEPALGLIESGDKTCDARLLDRAVSKQLKTFAGKRCYVLARSASRELVLHVPRYHLYATFGNAYAYHRRDLVPASWCSSDQPEDIQRFYESSFYGRTLPPIADSIVVFEVQVVRVSARHGRIISD